MAKIELDAFYPYPVEQVWEALTQPAALAQWLMKNEGFQAVVGQKFLFKAKPVMGWKGTAYCEVLTVDRPHLLRWSQRGEEHEAKGFTITWTLKAEGAGTRLSLLHEGLDGLQGLLIKQVMGSGWKRMLKQRIPLILQYAQENGWQKFPDHHIVAADCHA